MRLSFYYQQEFLLHPALRLNQLYDGEMFIDIPKFRQNAFIEFAWYPMTLDTRHTKITQPGTACIQFGWNSDPVAPVIRTDFNVIDCYKTIIQTFTDWSQWSP